MIKILTTEEARGLDRYTITEEPITSTDLVERAADVFTAAFLRRFPEAERVIVFAGRGNNGADALAIARLLCEKKPTCKVSAYLFNPPGGRLSPECEQEKGHLSRTPSVAFMEVAGGNFHPPLLGATDWVIDGLFGSGLNRPLEGGFAAVVDYINASKARVVSVDIPSGLSADRGPALEDTHIVRADFCFTFGAPKPAFFFPESAPFAGAWEVLDIGLHPKGLAEIPAALFRVEEADIRERLHRRKRFDHKGVFGHAGLIAGSRGKMGAALLAARACLRGGAGLLTLHAPICGEEPLLATLPEAMFSPDADADCFSSLPQDIERWTALGIGPGLGQDVRSAAALKALLLSLQDRPRPLVLDADALNLLAASPALLPPLSLLTPHLKEFDRLCGESASQAERLEKARDFAAAQGVILILKGAYTATCLPDRRVFFNSTGNPGMATAGSGDVLTGLLTALLAQGYEPADAALCGVYLHGLAGDLAAAEKGEDALLAGDLVEMLGKAFLKIKGV